MAFANDGVVLREMELVRAAGFLRLPKSSRY
ncbi:MAG: hypothetical protein HPKKFMNG_02044 [Planctomycetes bacterium]|nr:hypothetical protein [Planctomycetota bacterium]